MRTLSVIATCSLLYPLASYAQTGSNCAAGFLDPHGSTGLNIEQTRQLIDHVDSGGEVRIRVLMPPADDDSLPSIFWFEPISMQILNDQVFAESQPLRWAPSAFTWQGGSAAVEPIGLRVSSTGEFLSYQPGGSFNTELRKISWCLSSSE